MAITTAADQPLFLFYLVNQLGESYFVNDNGEVDKSGVPTPLRYSPDGWQDITIQWERNLDKFGLVRNFSLTLGFFDDGAKILSFVNNTINIDAKLWLLVQKRTLEITPYVDDANPGEWDVVYRFYYKGEVDLSTFRKSRRRVDVNIMEGGRAADLEANQGTAMEIKLSNPETIRVLMEGVNFLGSATFVIPAAQGIINGVPITYLKTDGTAINLEFESQPLAEATEFFIKNVGTTPVTIPLNGTIKFTIDNNRPTQEVHIYLQRYNAAMAYINTLQEDFFKPVAPGVVYTCVYAFAAITLQPGESLGLVDHTIPTAGGDITIQPSISYQETNITTSFKTKYADSFVRYYRPLDLFRRYVERLSGDKALAVSQLLAGSSLCFTSGDGLRGFKDAVIKGTPQDFFQFWRAAKCAGLGIEDDKIVLEKWTHFIDFNEIVDLGEVSNFEHGPALEVIYNTIQAGYQDQQYDDLNGRFEMNVLTQYSSPRRRAPKKLDLVSPIRADMYGMEKIRSKLDGKITTDSSSDNDTFCANIDLEHPYQDADGTYYKVKRANYTKVDGAADPASMYNVEELTPKRFMAEWAQFLRGSFKGYESGVLKFETSDKNKNFATYGGPGGSFVEKADIPIAGLGAPLFTNEIFKCTARGPINLQEVLKARPRAAYRVWVNGQAFLGILLKGAIQCKTNQEQQFIFLSHPDNDFKTADNE